MNPPIFFPYRTRNILHIFSFSIGLGLLVCLCFQSNSKCLQSTLTQFWFQKSTGLGSLVYSIGLANCMGMSSRPEPLHDTKQAISNNQE